MPSKANQICENSLRWILAMRRSANMHRYNMYEITAEKYPEVFGDSVGDFGHSGGSFRWTLEQAKRIDSIGLGKWLQTEAAQGYLYAYTKRMNAFYKAMGADKPSVETHTLR